MGKDVVEEDVGLGLGDKVSMDGAVVEEVVSGAVETAGALEELLSGEGVIMMGVGVPDGEKMGSNDPAMEGKSTVVGATGEKEPQFFSHSNVLEMHAPKALPSLEQASQQVKMLQTGSRLVQLTLSVASSSWHPEHVSTLVKTQYVQVFNSKTHRSSVRMEGLQTGNESGGMGRTAGLNGVAGNGGIKGGRKGKLEHSVVSQFNRPLRHCTTDFPYP